MANRREALVRCPAFRLSSRRSPCSVAAFYPTSNSLRGFFVVSVPSASSRPLGRIRPILDPTWPRKGHILTRSNLIKPFFSFPKASQSSNQPPVEAVTLLPDRFVCRLWIRSPWPGETRPKSCRIVPDRVILPSLPIGSEIVISCLHDNT